ncbi:hypothetical protein KS880_000943 [Vibrio parahaemolyticus]|nr:hypothetical protein [Vibrio parahaemolyticus]
MTKTFSGKRQIKEVISSMLISEILNPKEIWLVSAWISNFDLLDNRSGVWDVLNHSWGHRTVTFFEVLETVAVSGCKVNLVVKEHETNTVALNEIKSKLSAYQNFKLLLSDSLHTKGLLTNDAFLSGSMNFTYSGTNRNDELMTFTRADDDIANMFLDFSSSYPMDEEVTDEVDANQDSEREDDDDEIYYY